MTEKERTALIQYRLEQANTAIDEVYFLLENNKLIIAVNRIYYGMYYALTALALKHKFRTSKHRQLIGWLNKTFVATGLIPTKYARMVQDAFFSRQRGDYEAFVTFKKGKVEEMLRDMIEFIGMVERLAE